jgi:phage terminase large subunit-like protein
VPESLRGPEHHAAWADEIGKWRRGDAAWDNLLLGLRIGDRPQVVVTTTPRPTRLMRRVMAMPDCVETRGATHDNLHLDAGWVAQMDDLYGGTRLGRQELEGEMIDEVVGALWTRAGLETRRLRAMPVAAVRVVVGVDPPAGTDGDACGIVAVARGADDFAYVLEDASVAGLSPEGWARAVAGCAARHGADRVIAEKNQGGAMVESVLRAAERAMPLTLVHAARGKVARAEPVAALYESGRAWHVGGFPALEDELCGLVVGGGYEGPGRSPDRADALVWAMTALMLHAPPTARVRTVGEGEGGR